MNITPPSAFIHAFGITLGGWLEYIGYTLAKYTDLAYLLGDVLRDFLFSCWALTWELIQIVMLPLHSFYGFLAYYGVRIAPMITAYAPSGTPVEWGLLVTVLTMVALLEAHARFVSKSPSHAPSMHTVQGLRAVRSFVITTYNQMPASNPDYEPSAPDSHHSLVEGFCQGATTRSVYRT